MEGVMKTGEIKGVWEVWLQPNPISCWYGLQSLAGQIYTTRTARGWSMQVLALKARTSACIIQRLEAGEGCSPSDQVLQRVLKVLKINVDQIERRKVRRHHFLKEVSKWKYLDTVQGTIDEAITVGRRMTNADYLRLSPGSICVFPKGKEPPDLSRYASRCLVINYSEGTREEIKAAWRGVIVAEDRARIKSVAAHAKNQVYGNAETWNSFKHSGISSGGQLTGADYHHAYQGHKRGQ
jgi:transcriptional regulator with XRE-family HTH domain